MTPARIPSSATNSSVATALAWGLGVALAFAAIAVTFYLASAHGYGGTSDTATTVLQGQAIGQGNVLLRGWNLPLDSFWTSNALLSAIAVSLFGVHAYVMHVDSALASALFVCAGVYVACESAATRAAKVAAATTVAVLLVIPAPMLEYYMVTGAYHVGTAVWTIAAFVALRRGRFGWAWGVAVACLAVGMLGDLDLLAFGILPVLAAGLVAMARRRSWRAGAPQVAAALASVALFELLRSVTVWLGGFGETTGGPLVKPAQLGTSLKNLFVAAGDLLGRSRAFAGYQVPPAVQALHICTGIAVVATLALATGWLVIGAVRGRAAEAQASPEAPGRIAAPAPWILDDLLVLATFSAAGTFLLQAVNGVSQARYLTVSILMACVLCGRVVGRSWTTIKAAFRRPVAIAALALAVALAAGLGYQLSTPSDPPSASALAAWLSAHHLQNGVGDYWSAAITTVDSGGQVTVRPVEASGGRITRFQTQSDAGWYSRPFQFLVFDTPIWVSVDTQSAARAFGPPRHIYRVGTYHVLVWNHPITVGAGTS